MLWFTVDCVKNAMDPGDSAVTHDPKEAPVVSNEKETDEQEFVETVVMPDDQKPAPADPEDAAFTT